MDLKDKGPSLEIRLHTSINCMKPSSSYTVRKLYHKSELKISLFRHWILTKEKNPTEIEHKGLIIQAQGRPYNDEYWIVKED